MLIGGIFLYAAYYGCDQSQAQRILVARSEADTARVLLWNGIFRFPIVLLYCFLGLGLAALVCPRRNHSGFSANHEQRRENLNVVFPVFVLNYFEPGFVGLIMVGLIAASMSSIDSALNSLAAVTVEDFIRPHLSSQTSPARLLLLGRACTILWGLFAVACAFQVENIAPTVLEAVNKVGSMVNGPLLALIASAILLKRVSQTHALTGFAAGLAGQPAGRHLLTRNLLAVVECHRLRLGVRLHLALGSALHEAVNACSVIVTAIVPICSKPAQRLYPDSAMQFFIILAVCIAVQCGPNVVIPSPSAG